MLSQAARRLGRPTLPLPPFGFASTASRILRATGSDIPPDLHRLLTHGRVLDTSALRDIFGYEPRHTTAEVFEQFRASIRPGVLAGVGAH